MHLLVLISCCSHVVFVEHRYVDCGVSRVTFRFRNSKKSNNGTDGNAGQIPQLLYRLPVVTECLPVTSVIGRKMDQSDAVHVLSLDFSHSVSPVSICTAYKLHKHFYLDNSTPLFCFSFLLSWSWCFLLGHVKNPQFNVENKSGLSYKSQLF